MMSNSSRVRARALRYQATRSSRVTSPAYALWRMPWILSGVGAGRSVARRRSRPQNARKQLFAEKRRKRPSGLSARQLQRPAGDVPAVVEQRPARFVTVVVHSAEGFAG